MHSIEHYRNEFISYLESKTKTREPVNLYEPITYILGLGGKRLRPVLVLMASEVFGTDYKKALDAALAIEVFHNFSLVHDDIMDDAPLRRGKETVHEKWDVNTGILSGDAMLITAYQLFENYDGDTFRDLAKLFSKTAIEVCEGQQYDVDFETRDDVTQAEYLKMIEYKTAVLVGQRDQHEIAARPNVQCVWLNLKTPRVVGAESRLSRNFEFFVVVVEEFGRRIAMVYLEQGPPGSRSSAVGADDQFKGDFIGLVVCQISGVQQFVFKVDGF